MWVAPNHPFVFINLTILVPKPMVTWGSPILRNTRMGVIIEFERGNEPGNERGNDCKHDQQIRSDGMGICFRWEVIDGIDGINMDSPPIYGFKRIPGPSHDDRQGMVG